MNDNEKVARADRARRLLESAEWTAAWEAYRAVLFNIIETTGDDAKALHARRLLQAATEARRHLETFVSDGQIAAHDIEAAKSRLRLA